MCIMLYLCKSECEHHYMSVCVCVCFAYTCSYTNNYNYLWYDSGAREWINGTVVKVSLFRIFCVSYKTHYIFKIY